MPTTVHEIAADIFRIASHEPGEPIPLVQFLIRDEMPLLFHTGPKALFPEVWAAIGKVIDPTRLRYISWSHLEADECGALNLFTERAPLAEPVHGEVAGMLGVGDFFDKPVTVISDDQVLDLGARKLRFMTTPHVPHSWDAITAFEETTKTLFVSDLFTSFGDASPVTESDVVEPALAALKHYPDFLPVGPHTRAVLTRLASLDPKVLAGHHSPAFRGNGAQALLDLQTQLLGADHPS